MTEPSGTSPSEYDVIEAALDDRRQQATNLQRAMSLQFSDAWQHDSGAESRPLTAFLERAPGVVTVMQDMDSATASGPVSIAVDLTPEREGHATLSSLGGGTISTADAADQLGVDVETAQRATTKAIALVQADISQHRTLEQTRNTITDLQQQLEATEEAAVMREQHREDLAREAVAIDPADLAETAVEARYASWDTAGEEPASGTEPDLDQTSAQPETTPQWATDSQDQSFTPARVMSDWVQSTTMVKTYLETDRVDLARQWIEELDENLAGFAEGGAPPGSDESFDVYHDAVARAAIPYGEAPITAAEVQQQLGNVGMHVPSLDLDSIRESTGITPLDRNYLTNKLNETTPDPALVDLASARLDVRRAIASITEDSEAAQGHLFAANTTLTQVVEMLRPETRPDVEAAKESVKQASERVEAVTETARKVEVEVTVYSTPDCVGCAATKRTLDKAGVEYEEINLAERPDLIQQFKRQGLAQAPIVETKNGERWAGFNPKKLQEHGLDHRTRQQRGNDPGRDTGHGR